MSPISYYNIHRLINILIYLNIVMFGLVLFSTMFYLKTYDVSDLFFLIPIIILVLFTTARLTSLSTTIYLFGCSNDNLKDHKYSLVKYSLSTLVSLSLLLEIQFKYSSYF